MNETFAEVGLRALAGGYATVMDVLAVVGHSPHTIVVALHGLF